MWPAHSAMLLLLFLYRLSEHETAQQLQLHKPVRKGTVNCQTERVQVKELTGVCAMWRQFTVHNQSPFHLRLLLFRVSQRRRTNTRFSTSNLKPNESAMSDSQDYKTAFLKQKTVAARIEREVPVAPAFGKRSVAEGNFDKTSMRVSIRCKLADCFDSERP